METLSELLISKQETYGNHDSDWVRFIHDHKQYLLNNSTKITLTDYESQQYKYDIREFVKDQGMDASVYWIIQYLNGMQPNGYIFDIDFLWTPPMSLIIQLRQQYDTLISKS